MAENKELDPFAGMKEVPSNWFKKGMVGDWIKGTLTSKQERANTLPDKQGEMQWVYEIIASGGVFHSIDENKKVSTDPTIVKEGEYWNIGGSTGVDAQLKNIPLGTIVAFKFTEEIPNKVKSYNAAKIVKVLVGGLDPNYQGQDSTMSEV